MAFFEETFPVRFGPFVLLRRLGAGGMGSAYLARHADLDNLLVVKRLHPELLRDETIFKRFVHEAEVAAHVRHPNVAAVVAMGTVDGEPFLATEFVFGIQVVQIVDRIEQSLVDPVPMAIGLALALELTRGVEAIHSACHRETGEPLGLIHRDIGSRNVLVGFDGRIRVIDLGLGKSELSDWQTAHQVLAGSPDYMSPEQAMGARVDGRADVYSAAVTIWELLAGRKRIRADSVAERLKLAVGVQPEALLDVRPDASLRLEAILKQAMATDPDLRTPTAAILRKTIDEERRSIGTRAETADVVAWLDAACATIIAKERRLLDDARALERRALRPVRAQTKFFVQETESLAQDPYAAYAVDMPPPAPTTGVRQTIGNLAKSQTAVRLAELVDPDRFRAAAPSTKLVFAAVVLAFMATVAGVTAWLLSPGDAGVTAEGLVAPPPPPPVVVAPPPPAPPPPAALEETVEQAQDRADQALLEQVEAVGPTPPPRAKTRTTRIARDVLSRRRGLVERLRTLRRQRFEIAFQRKLTKLSTQLSRARSHDRLDDIEAQLRRLESE